jgi:hypothetical protein
LPPGWPAACRLWSVRPAPRRACSARAARTPCSRRGSPGRCSQQDGKWHSEEAKSEPADRLAGSAKAAKRRRGGAGTSLVRSPGNAEAAVPTHPPLGVPNRIFFSS